jgi:hypothetical protein
MTILQFPTQKDIDNLHIENVDKFPDPDQVTVYFAADILERIFSHE